MRGIEFESPGKYAEQSDSDTDFQGRGAESDGEESAEEDRRKHTSPQELQNVEVSPSRGKVGPQGSSPSGKGTKLRTCTSTLFPLPTTSLVP